jgi:hypothetical protein
VGEMKIFTAGPGADGAPVRGSVARRQGRLGPGPDPTTAHRYRPSTYGTLAAGGCQLPRPTPRFRAPRTWKAMIGWMQHWARCQVVGSIPSVQVRRIRPIADTATVARQHTRGLGLHHLGLQRESTRCAVAVGKSRTPKPLAVLKTRRRSLGWPWPAIRPNAGNEARP